jgi:calcineurin-like phosphoesterase family protein
MKDLSNMLNYMHPNSKVYVISDHHFGHKNIIGYGRNQFEDVDAMNNYIFNTHNSIVNEDDVVIFLGDVSFTSSAKNIVKNMKGHKYLIAGNHDKSIGINNFSDYGFENIYRGVVKLGNNIYFSHYPLDEELIKEESELDLDTRNDLMAAIKEFRSNKDAKNYFGHLHTYVPLSEKFVNCSCEMLNFKPHFLCLLKSYTSNLDCNNPDFILSAIGISKKINCGVEEILIDYIFSQVLNRFNDSNVFLYGSYSLFKTMNIRLKWSDLDLSFMPDLNKSSNYNKNILRNEFITIKKLFDNMNNYNYLIKKKYDYCRIMDVYSTFLFNQNIKTYIDMNLMPFPIYSDSDFINVNSFSIYDNQFNKEKTKNVTGSIKCLKPEIVYLSYIYKFIRTNDFEIIKRMNLLERDRRISDSLENLDEVENMLTKILLFNVMFLCMMCEKKNITDCFSAFDSIRNLPKDAKYLFDSAYNNSGILKDAIRYLKGDLESGKLVLKEQRKKIEEIAKVLKK